MSAAAFLDRPSCFETLRAYSGKIFRLSDHCARLADSCQGMGMSYPEKTTQTARWLIAQLRQSRMPDALIRLSVHWDECGAGFFSIIVRPFTAHPLQWHQAGVRVTTAVHRRSSPKAQDAQIKASQFVCGVLAVAEKSAEAHEMLLLGPGGTVAEGTVSNIFIVKEKRLLTPSVSSGILRGVSRAVTLEAAQKLGIQMRETALTRHDLYSADECFMTNTSSEVLPVIAVDQRRIGAGVPGPVTKKLAQAFKTIIASELSE